VVASPEQHPSAPSLPARADRGNALVERNPFCSSCAVGPDDPSIDTPAVAGDELPLTSLPLVLVATSLDDDPASSFATVRNAGSGAQGAFTIGERLPGAGPVERIAGRYLVFHNDESNRSEKLALLDVRVADKPVASAAPERGGAAPARADSDAFADRVRKIDDTNYEIDRGLIGELVSGGGKVKGVRATPVGKDGKLEGVRLSVRPDSVGAAMGLHSGDVVRAVGGVGLDSVDKLMSAYARLGDARSVTMDVERAGKPVTITYQLR
jgi:hypothetical protein